MLRTIKTIFTARQVQEGAGVLLHRVFGSPEAAIQTDPFLLLDDFSAHDPEAYIAGFPWHPHRGIETVTYLRAGKVQHGDSIGNKGVIGDGDVQWMTAGSGIIHEEMPLASPRMQGFQLWVNLPRQHKLMTPRYQDIKSAQLAITQDGAAELKVICGKLGQAHGPVQEVMAEPLYVDAFVPAGKPWQVKVPAQYTVLLYVYEGGLKLDAEVKPGQCALLTSGDTLLVQTETDARFLLIGGQPLHEPIAWAGPIVMNSQAELDTAFREYNNGTFIKS